MAKPRSTNRKTRDEMDKLEIAVRNNADARLSGPRAKSWAPRDLNTITPQTENQEDMFQAYLSGQFEIVAHGSAGSGKTFLACYLAMNDILNKKQPQKKVIIVRSNVATRELGHLPGTVEEKMMQYEQPYRDIFSELFRRPNTYDDMKEAGIVEFVPTSFVRGVTWHDSIIIVDEAQNMNFHEIDSIVTRMGLNSKIFILGDTRQNDLATSRNKKDLSGLEKAIRVAKRTKKFAIIKFTPDDIMRIDLVRDWIIASEDDIED